MNKINTISYLNIAENLKNNARLFPDKKAIIYPDGKNKDGSIKYGHKTFKDIDKESDQYAMGFESAGITIGTKTIFMVKPGPDLFSITFALFKVGAVPVIVDPGLGMKRMLHCYNAAKAEAFIGIKRAHIFRLIFSSHFKSVKTWVTAGKRLFWGGYSLKKLLIKDNDEYPLAHTQRDDLALINFTTGSTGPAKGVEYTQRMINEEFQSLKLNLYKTLDQIDMATLSLFALYDILIGITAILPKIDPSKPASVNSMDIINPVNDFKATIMFASPALLNTVGKFGVENNIKLPTMKTVLSGGAPVTTTIMETFQKLLHDDASILTTYGATEALPISLINSKTLLSECKTKTIKGMGTCIGKPLKNVNTRIIKITDEPLEKWHNDLLVPQGEVGEIVLNGDIVSKRYYQNKQANAVSKIKDGNEIWHRMGDLGSIDEKGRIWFCGRKNHRVFTGQNLLFSVQCEGIFNSHPEVLRSALVGINEKNKTKPVICIELDQESKYKLNKADELKLLKQELFKLGQSNNATDEITTILFHKSFPVDIRHNAKIGREQLVIWAENILNKEVL
jgi:acyl-CoA synthetase (AMP-forming)/AMP-acid ligase II